MKTAVLGGTGKLGLALAHRLFQSGHEGIVGSRDSSKAVEAAQSLDAGVGGKSNGDAAR
jgi:predicted dinucleotide-binding enzyme